MSEPTEVRAGETIHTVPRWANIRLYCLALAVVSFAGALALNRPELAPAVWAVPFVTTLVVFPATVFADRAGWLRTGRRVEGTTFSTSSAIGAAIAVTLSDLPGVAHEWAMVVAAANAAALTGLFLGLAVTSPFTARKRP